MKMHLSHFFVASLLLTSALFGRTMLLGGCSLGKIMMINEESKILWEMADKREVSDIWQLPNGNILHTTKHGIQEITPDLKTGKGAKIIWQVKAPANTECHACQPLENGRILVGYSAQTGSYLAEIDSTGKIYKKIPVAGQNSKHGSFRQVRKTKEGTYLTSQQCGGGKAKEYSADGKLLRTFPAGRFSAERLPSGNTLIGCGDEHRLIEVNKDNKIVWEVKQNDIPGIKLGFVAGIAVLKNGNILLCNWGGHGGAKGSAVVEINRKKELIWASAPTIKNFVSSICVNRE